jgi:hypothetical protein
MTSQKLTYSMASGTINGNIGNKNIRIVVRPAQAGRGPTAGNYIINPPVNDPIYGMVAMMTPSTSSAQSPGATNMLKWKLTSPTAIKTVTTAPKGTAEQVFVLSSRPIPGQNSLVVSSGYADLMDALRAAGGASVTAS